MKPATTERLGLPPVETVDALPAEVLPAFLATLAALQTRIAARLAAQPIAAGNRDRDRVVMADNVDVRAAARLLGISPTAVRRHVTAGTLATVRLGRRLLFRRETLERFAADHEALGENRS